MSDNLIYVKLSYEEAIEAKRDILSFEMNLLRVLKRVKNYHKIRSAELKTKLRIYRKIKELKTNLNKLGNTLPEIKIPKILSKGRAEIVGEKKVRGADDYSDSALDIELKEIQERLKKLE